MNIFHKFLSRFKKKDGIFFDKMEQLLGFPPKEIHYYDEAFTSGQYVPIVPNLISAMSAWSSLAMPSSGRSSLTLSSYRLLIRMRAT